MPRQNPLGLSRTFDQQVEFGTLTIQVEPLLRIKKGLGIHSLSASYHLDHKTASKPVPQKSPIS